MSKFLRLGSIHIRTTVIDAITLDTHEDTVDFSIAYLGHKYFERVSTCGADEVARIAHATAFYQIVRDTRTTFINLARVDSVSAPVSNRDGDATIRIGFGDVEGDVWFESSEDANLAYTALMQIL